MKSGVLGIVYENEIGTLDVEVWRKEGFAFNPDNFRHATESEIAQEKERRLFAEHGRKPWELRKGGVLQNKHTGMAHIRVVTRIIGGEPRFDLDEIIIDYKRNFHVVCFAENRLVISHEKSRS